MEIVKSCKKHGDLTIDEVNKNKRKDKLVYRCKECQKESRDKHYSKNKDAILKKNQEFREKDPEDHKRRKYESWLRNKENYRLRHQEECRRYRERHYEKVRRQDTEKKRLDRENLNDSYIKDKIAQGSCLQNKDIPQSLVEMKRQIYALKRGVRKKNNEKRMKELEEQRNDY